MNQKWLEKLLKSPKIFELHQELQKGASVLTEELWNSPKALVAALAQQATAKHVLILTGASQEEVRLFHDFPFFTENPVIDFPAWETLPSENVAPRSASISPSSALSTASSNAVSLIPSFFANLENTFVLKIRKTSSAFNQSITHSPILCKRNFLQSMLYAIIVNENTQKTKR